jgi:hypothetical protein
MAAGLGFKTFATGDVLSAADVNGYLMQGVLVFASAAARDAAITSPQEGQFAYLKDTNVTTYYTGSAWTNLDTTGMVNPMTTTGDTIYSSSGSTPARLGIGSTGQVLTVSSGIPSWATPASGGGLTSIASGSLSSTAVNLTSISQSYVNLYLVLRDVNITSAGQIVNMRFNNDSSGIYQINNSSNNGYQTNATDTSLLVGIGNMSTSNGDASFAININDYTSASWKIGTATSFFLDNSGGYGNGDQRFAMRSTTAISEINLFMTSGNFSGTYILYGAK